jgi:hypothetical protein
VEDDMGGFILSINEGYNEGSKSKKNSYDFGVKSEEMLKLYFDGAYSKEGARARIVLISPIKEKIHFSYKLEFDVTNNVVEYDALIQVWKLLSS